MRKYYIDDVTKLGHVRSILLQYTRLIEAALAVDFETDSVLEGELRPIWDGTRYLSRPILFAIGTSTLLTETRFMDLQFVINCTKISKEDFVTHLKDILEETPLIAQNAGYEAMFLHQYYDIHPKKWICTFLASQIHTAGDQLQHGADSLYRRYMTPDLVKFACGMELGELIALKEAMQKSDWSGELSERQLFYSATDVIFPHHVWREEETAFKDIDSKRHNPKPGTGLLSIAQLEFANIENIALMELHGFPFNKEKCKELIPLLKTEMDRLSEEIAKFPAMQIEERYSNKYSVSLDYPIDPLMEQIRDRLNKAKIKATVKKHGLTYHNEIYITSNKSNADAISALLQEFSFLEPLRVGVVNVNSNLVLKKALSAHLGEQLPGVAREVLEKYERDPLIGMLLNRAKITKLSGTYLNNLDSRVTPRGRIHGRFIQVGTDTGRMAGSEPNMTNIPAGGTFTINGTQQAIIDYARDLFIAEDKHILISLDYSQIEPRVMAAFYNDTAMINGFINGIDYHASTAQKIFNLDYLPEDADPYRKKGKKINLSVSYLQSGFSLAQEIEDITGEPCPKEVGESYVRGWFDAYPQIKAGFERMKNALWHKPKHFKSLAPWKRKNQPDGQRVPIFYTETVFGRRRFFYLLAAHEHMEDYELAESYIPPGKKSKYSNVFYTRLREIERQAFNAPIQGSAADIQKLGLLYTCKFLRSENVDPNYEWVIASVHDELILHVKEENAMHFATVCSKLMQKAAAPVLKKVPCKVDVKFGKTWKELDKSDAIILEAA